MPFASFLSQYSPDTTELILSVRSFLWSLVPNAIEEIDLKSKLIAYNIFPGMDEIVFTLIPAKRWVTIGFFRGSELDDPEMLFSGTGKVHRSVRITTPEDLKKDSFIRLTQSAIDAALNRSGNKGK
jgi:hypothetical protein